MLAQVEINVEKTDWECLNLLSKKEKIPVPDLIGRMIASKLEEYEDFQDALSLEIAMRNHKPGEGITLEELCKKHSIKL